MKPQRYARVSLQWASVKVSQVLHSGVPHFGGAWKTIVNELHVDHRARLGNLPNSKECQIFLGVMQNNILNLFF